MVGQRLVMDGHADRKSAGTEEKHEGHPRRDYSIIRGTLLWTRATLTNLPSGTGCRGTMSDIQEDVRGWPLRRIEIDTPLIVRQRWRRKTHCQYRDVLCSNTSAVRA